MKLIFATLAIAFGLAVSQAHAGVTCRDDGFGGVRCC